MDSEVASEVSGAYIPAILCVHMGWDTHWGFASHRPRTGPVQAPYRPRTRQDPHVFLGIPPSTRTCTAPYPQDPCFFVQYGSVRVRVRTGAGPCFFVA